MKDTLYYFHTKEAIASQVVRWIANKISFYRLKEILFKCFTLKMFKCILNFLWKYQNKYFRNKIIVLQYVENVIQYIKIELINIKCNVFENW